MDHRSTFRTMAKTWRSGDVAARRNVERAITARNAWDAFRYDREGKLIARYTDADRARQRNADCHFHKHASGQFASI